MKTILILLPALLLVCGCVTSTVEKRKQERYGAYSALPPDTRSLVDEGKIKVGMNMDAVYIAWGKPSQIVQGESSAGAITTWLYQGTYLQPYRYWTYRHAYYYGGCYGEPYLSYEYFPISYVRAEIIFENNLVKEWRSLPRPQGY